MAIDDGHTARLDPQIEMLLFAFNALGDTSAIQRDVSGARTALAALAAMQYPSKVEMEEVEDVEIDGGPSLRIYWPKPKDQCEGVLIFFHGGGFVLGGIETHDGLVRSLAQKSGAVVVSVEYALAPEHKFPYAVNDAVGAMNWVLGKRPDLTKQADSPVVFCGDSAGGNLAAIVAREFRDHPGVAGQILLYPVLDAVTEYPSQKENAQGYFLTEQDLLWFSELYLPNDVDRSHPWLSPALCDDIDDLPRALIVVAGFDPLRDQGVVYAARITESGGDATLWEYPSMIHGFFNLEMTVEVAKEAVVATAKFTQELFQAHRSDGSLR